MIKALTRLAVALLVRLGLLWRPVLAPRPVPVPLLAMPFDGYSRLPLLSLGLPGDYPKPQTGGEP